MRVTLGVVALLVALAAPARAQHVDPPRPQGALIAAAARPLGPTPPFAGAPAAAAPGCARETLVRIAGLISWLRTLPAGDLLAAAAEPRLAGRCAPRR